MMDELSNSTPEKLRLSTLSETEGRVKSQALQLQRSDISKFLSSLESSDYFSNVLLNTIEQVEEEGIKPNPFLSLHAWMFPISILLQRKMTKKKEVKREKTKKK